MKKYITPDFKAEKFEVEDVICLSYGGTSNDTDVVPGENNGSAIFSAEGGMAVSELLK